MATRKRTSVASETPTIPRRHVPEVCPVCQAMPDPLPVVDGQPKPTTESILRAHLERHRPTQPCRNEAHQGQANAHQGWELDWDMVQYPRPDVSFWYCDPCGYYAPTTTAE